MSNATVLPLYAVSKFFFWNSKLTNSLDDLTTAQTVYWSEAPRDENNAIITGAFLIAVRNTRRNPNRTEMMYVPASGVAADGLSATGVIRGLKPSGLDYTAGSSTFVYEFDSGDEIFCAIVPQDGELLRSAIQGIIASGAVQQIMGADAAATVTHKRSTGVGTSVGYVRWDTSTSKAQFSNDGTTWTSFDSVSASNLVQASAADTTPGYLNDKIDVATAGRLIKSIGNPAANETIRLTLATTSTDAELNKLTGASANVTAANLGTLTAGAASNADALHTHSTLNLQSYTAYEAITADDAVALLPVEVEYFSQLTDVNLALGSSNTLRRYAVKIIPTATTSTLTTMQFRAAEAVNGATALGDLTISIQTDSASAPSGTVITNGTANVISQVTQRTWTATKANRTATWATPPTLTAGTTYWVVWSVAATDATNFLNLGENSTYDENYLTFTRLTYNLDTATWGGSVTNATPFFWFNTQTNLLGFAVVPTDADFAGRAWRFIGFAASTVSALASVSVETDMANLTGLIADGNLYYLSSTAGAITQTKPGNLYNGNAASYSVGIARSSTQFQIEKGEKLYFGALAPTGAATTAHALIPWFKVKTMELSGAYVSSATISHVTMRGIFEGSSNYAVGFVSDDGGSEIALSQTSASFGDTTGSLAARWAGSGASVTNVGFTYSVTKTSTPSDYAILYTLRG